MGLSDGGCDGGGIEPDADANVEYCGAENPDPDVLILVPLTKALVSGSR